MKKDRNFGMWAVYAAALGAMLFWGCSYVWSTIVFEYWNPFIVAFFRAFFSSLLLFLMLKLLGQSAKIDRKDYKTLFVLSLFNPALYFLFENFGLLHSSPTISAGIVALIPVFITIMAFFVLQERLRFQNIVGIALSFGGIWMMLINKEMTFEATWYGVVFLFLAVAMAVCYAAFIRPLSLKYNPFVIVAWQNLIGSVLFLPVFLIFGLRQLLSTPITMPLIKSFLMLLIFASTLAFPFHTYVIRRLGVSRASIFSNLIPVVTAVVSFFILREPFSVNKITGIAMVVGGVFLSQIGKIKLNNR
ncbi:MAG: DMT family transporter [Bacteroidales bacterium]|jgi:drug/metabolite transporter (DMT)-like permease|nr:DMT family transporter [Bacteroidales bacterium]